MYLPLTTILIISLTLEGLRHTLDTLNHIFVHV